MSSSNKLPRSMKNLWTLLSGSVNLKSLQFVADELEQSQQQLIEGILFYKPNNSDEKEKNSSIPIGKITEIRNMSIFLDLDQDQCYQLFQSYLLYEYKGTPEMAKSLFNNEKQRKELFEQLWSYYYSERIFTLFCFKQILSNWKSNEHIYSKIFQDFIKYLNTENQLLTKLVDQLKLLIRFNFDSRSKYGPYFSEKFQNDLRENIQKEQSEILQLLLLYYKNFEPSIENVIQLLKLFSENVFLNKSMSSNLNEFIGLLKSLLIVECLDPNYLYKCHMDGIEHFILKSDNGTSIDEINTLILSLNTSVTDNSPIFLCWMIISILDNSVSSDYVERLGNTALELKVFKYLHRCLQSTHLSTLNGSLVYNLVHEIIGNLLAVTFSTFDFDRLIQTEPSLSHLLIELFQNDLIAKMVFESSINTGLGLPIRYALDMFPHKTYFLLSLLHSLSKTNSCKSIFETVSILNTITTYCEQLDGNFVPIDSETVMLIEDRSVLPEDKIVIAKNTKGTIFNLDGRRMVKWNNIVLNGWRLLFYRLKYLTNQIKQGQMSSVMLNDEIVLQEISTVAFICSQLIAHNAYHPISHFKQIVNLLLDTFKLMVNFNQSSIRLFMAGIIQLCASIMKESFLPSEQIWFLLTEKKFLPYMIGYSNQFEEILTGTDTNISTLGYILSTDEFIKGNYELTISFMEIILYCVKRDEFLRENSIIASFIFVIKDIFPSYRLWNYRNEKDANQIGSMCIEIFYNLLNRARKRSSSKLEQIEKICTILLMEGNSAEYLLQIVRNGEETVKEKIMNSGNDALLVKDDQIITVRTSLLILSYLLELYAYVGVSEQKSKSVIEDLLFSSLNNSNPNMLLIFTYFIYQKYDIYLATNAMQLLSQLAYKFPMSMLACFGSNTESIRDHFLFRLETVTEDINFKISLLNFLSICVEHQPGLVEMFLNVSNDKGGVLNSVLEILEEKLEGQYLCPFELHQATLQFVAKFWLRPNIIAINLLKKNDKFWKLVSFPLFIGDKEQFHNSLCSYILKILSRELFYLKMLEKSDVVNQNLDQIFVRMKKELIIDKLSKHIQEKIILPLNIDDDAVYLIDAWKDFLSSWTMFKQSESINLNVINDLLKNLSKLLNENEDGKYSKIVNKMSNLLLFLSSSWNSETIDLLKKGDFIENIIELFGNVIQNKEIISFNALISLNTCLLKTLVQMDELNQEPLFQHVCHMLNNSIQLISKQLNSRRDKINSDLNMEKKLVNVHLFIMITMMENVKKNCEKYIEILNKFEISELIFNLIIYLIHNNIHLDLGQNLPLYFITVSRWSQGADLLHNQNIINNIAVYFRLPNQLFQSKEINIDHDHVCNILSLLIRTVINMTIHLRHHFVESCISFIAVYSDSFCELCQAFRRNKQLKLANNVLLVIQLCSILSKYVKIWHSSHPISLKLMIEEVLFTSNSVIAFLLRPTLLRQTQQDLSMAQASTSNINNQLRLPSNGKELTIQANNLLLQILLYSFKFISDISPNLFELLEENSFNGIHQLHLSTNFSIPNVDSLEVLTFGSLVNFINFSIKSIYKFEKDSITSADKRRDMNLELSLLEFAMTILLNQSLIAKNTRTINEVDKQIFLREITNEMNTIITNLSTKPQRRQNSISMTITPIASRHSLTSTLYLMEKPYIQLMVKLMDNVLKKMAPVHIPPNNSKPQQEKPKKPTERRPELFCRVKYCNTLPDIPFDPKFISYPFDTGRFVQYKQTSLEKNYKHDLLTEQDLGVAIDLINPETYEISDSGSRLAEEDERLLEDEHSAPQDTKRSRCHNRAITWLKKTEYISTEFNRYGSSSDKTETKLGFGVKKKLKEENLYLDRENQILVINKTFESAKKPIMSHPGKPGIKPVEILPVFPDFDGWKYPFAQVIFDADPASSEKEEEMSQAMIRGVMDESGQQFVAYFLPTQDTINKRKIDQLEERDYTEDQEYEYIMAREYNWNVKNKATKGYEENYFFVWKDDVVCYNELETRVKLSKRRVKHNQPTNSRLVVKHRPINEQEYKVQEIRFAQLEPPQDDEELNNDEDVDAEEKSKEADDKINSPDDNNQNIQSESEKSESSDSEVERNSSKRTKVSDESEEKSSSSSASSSSSSGSSSDDSEDEEESRRKRQKQTAADIFGSDSD